MKRVYSIDEVESIAKSNGYIDLFFYKVLKSIMELKTYQAEAKQNLNHKLKVLKIIRYLNKLLKSFFSCFGFSFNFYI